MASSPMDRYCKYCDFLKEYTVVFLKVWCKVYIFLKCPECILPKRAKGPEGNILSQGTEGKLRNNAKRRGVCCANPR